MAIKKLIDDGKVCPKPSSFFGSRDEKLEVYDVKTSYGEVKVAVTRDRILGSDISIYGGLCRATDLGIEEFDLPTVPLFVISDDNFETEIKKQLGKIGVKGFKRYYKRNTKKPNRF